MRAVDAVEAGAHPGGCRGVAGHGAGARCTGGWPRYREGGKDALKAQPVPGRPPKLTGAQMRTLYTLIVGAGSAAVRSSSSRCGPGTWCAR